jgi:hypothetical protein
VAYRITSNCSGRRNLSRRDPNSLLEWLEKLECVEQMIVGVGHAKGLQHTVQGWAQCCSLDEDEVVK